MRNICKLAVGIITMVVMMSQTYGQQDYRIAPGDRISINVYGEPDLTFPQLPVPTDGIITYPFLGQVQVQGKTKVELANDITRGLLDGYLLQPQVTVAIIGFRPIFIGGAVTIPGQKEFSIDMDVERLIALAGGFTDRADVTDIVIQRKDNVGRYELKAAIDSEVKPGDVVSVGELEIEEVVVQYFYLQGEINSPGRYEYSKGLTVRQSVAIAGGFSVRASQRKISITRGETQQKLNKVGLDIPVQAGDVITVGASLF